MAQRLFPDKNAKERLLKSSFMSTPHPNYIALWLALSQSCHHATCSVLSSREIIALRSARASVVVWPPFALGAATRRQEPSNHSHINTSTATSLSSGATGSTGNGILPRRYFFLSYRPITLAQPLATSVQLPTVPSKVVDCRTVFCWSHSIWCEMRHTS
jgi:hypothetical protein